MTATDPFRDADLDIECSCGAYVAANTEDLPVPCPSCGAEVTEGQVYRVLVVSRTYHYETVTAQNAAEQVSQ